MKNNELLIAEMYERNHKRKWYELTDDEKAEYYNRNIWRYKNK
jgi:hypothetical protein